mgnify:CR=1 FL=1
MKTKFLFKNKKEQEGKKVANISCKTNGTIFLITFLFLMSFSIVVVSAAQETTIYSFPEGIDIVEQQQETIMYNTDYFYHFHLLNSSNGAVITNDTIYCSFFIANETGNVIFGSNVTYVGPYWEIKVDGTVIKIGESPYGLICIGENIGGSLSGTFNATSTGEDGSMFYLILLTSLAIIFLLASLNCQSLSITFLPNASVLKKEVSEATSFSNSKTCIGFSIISR